MSTTSPVATAYQKLVTTGRLQPNAAQASLVQFLGQLQHSLVKGKRWFNDARPQQNGVYIYGGVGTGKSRIADLFASTLPGTISNQRIHFHEFMADVHLRLHHARSQANYAGDPLIRIGQEIQSQSPVLCFDEFQVSDIADAMILKRLFGSFWQSGGVMVSTSNRHPTELYLNGLNRPLFVPFIEELQQRCLVWNMQGDQDYRMVSTNHDRVQVFFTDPKAFELSLTAMTGDAAYETTPINVAMNRLLLVKAKPSIDNPNNSGSRTGRLVASTTFPELCEAPLGTTDYHSLCNFAHTIYMSGLRQFAAHELDFVRRFITLIDIAYEMRTRILCLSKVPLTHLFANVGIVAKSKSLDQTEPSKDLEKVPGSPKLSIGSLTVRGQGGSSSSMMSTFIDNVEWSATGLSKASLATGGAGETDVRFAIGRALSRMAEMSSIRYGVEDETSE